MRRTAGETVSGDGGKHRLDVLGQDHRPAGEQRPSARGRHQQQSRPRRQPAAGAGIGPVAGAAPGRGEQRLHVVEQRRRDMRRRRLALPAEQRGRVGERGEQRNLRAAVAPGQEFPFRGRIGVAQVDRHQEAVQLRLGQRVGADLLDRVLRGDDEERGGQLARLAVQRHLPLLHRLEQRALRLGRRAVDLVGEHDRMEDRPGVEAERMRLRVVDRHAEHVGRQEVARELHARVLESQRRRQRLRQRRLADPGDVLDQQVPAGEQAGQREPQRRGLADDDALDLREDGGEPLVDRDAVVAERSD